MTNPGPTLAAYTSDPDPNAWWQLGSGDHLNLLEEAVDALADAEAVVRVLVDTGGECCATYDTGAGWSHACDQPPGHSGDHTKGGYQWTGGEADEGPSPWSPDLLAALDRITGR